MPGRIKTLIVDDEPLARERIRSLLASDPDFEILGEAGNGEEAVIAIDGERPDLLFLDVQMPGLDGFQVLEAIGAEEMPVTIFVTAYDQYAIRAFEVHALDYLLKPFDRQRFQQTLDRAKSVLQQQAQAPELNQRLLSLISDFRTPARPVERLVVKAQGRVYFVATHEIDWIEAAGNYLKLHVGANEHLIRETMNAIEERLDPSQFVRIHRSTIVNIERVKELQPWFHGDFVVLLKDGQQLTLSRNYREKVQERLGISF